MKKTKKHKKNKHLGSDFNDFLRKERFLEITEEVAAKYAFLMQLEDKIQKQNLAKEKIGKQKKTG